MCIPECVQLPPTFMPTCYVSGTGWGISEDAEATDVGPAFRSLVSKGAAGKSQSLVPALFPYEFT